MGDIHSTGFRWIGKGLQDRILSGWAPDMILSAHENRFLTDVLYTCIYIYIYLNPPPGGIVCMHDT